MGVLSNLNYIKNVFRHPCATPSMEVLIETALPAAALAVSEVFLFGCRDIIKMRAGRKPWHSRGLNSLLKNVSKGTKINPKLWGFSIAFAPFEAGLQYLLYADVATGFVANWMSLIYQEQRCTLPGAGFLSCPLTSLYLGPPGPNGFFIQCTAGKECISIGGDIIRIPAGCEATISWQAEFRPFLDDPIYQGNVTSYMVDDEGKRYSTQPGYPTPDGLGQTVGGGAHIRAKPPFGDRLVHFEWVVDKGIMACTRGHVSVSSYGRHMPLIAAGCSPRNFDQPYPH